MYKGGLKDVRYNKLIFKIVKIRSVTKGNRGKVGNYCNMCNVILMEVIEFSGDEAHFYELTRSKCSTKDRNLPKLSPKMFNISFRKKSSTSLDTKESLQRILLKPSENFFFSFLLLGTQKSKD